MKSATDVKIYYDRMLVSELMDRDRDAVKAMAEWAIGRIDQKKRIHFCGMIRLPAGHTVVFLPRSMKDASVNSAATTISVLQKFGSDTATREMYSDGEAGNPGMLSVILRLAEDFRNNGIYVERQRFRARNSGKPDWKRTVSRAVSFPCQGGAEVFDHIATTRTVDSSDTLIGQIQAVVMEEIIAQHSWWIGGLEGRRLETKGVAKPRYPRELWIAHLESLLPRLFTDRAIFLAKFLSHYLAECRASESGSYLFGVEDFHTIWETMLRRTLKNVDTGWNSKFPKPTYRKLDGAVCSAGLRGLQTDIILKQESGFVIVDAKYYSAQSSNSAPGVADITKQMFYELALRDVIGPRPKIRNVFLFPSRHTNSGPLASVNFVSSSGRPSGAFTTILCRYIAIDVVMAAYVRGSQSIELP